VIINANTTGRATNATNISTNTSNILATGTKNHADLLTVSGLAGAVPTATGVIINANTTGRATNTSNIATKAPNDATYLTLSVDGDLTAERVLTAGSGLRIVDAGANGALTLNASGVTVTAGNALAGGGLVALGGSISLAVAGDSIDTDELADACSATTSFTAPLIEGSTSVQTPLIEFTDGDNAIGIANSGVLTIHAGTRQAGNVAADGSTVTFNMDLANRHRVTLGGNRTLVFASCASGQAFTTRLKQDGTGSRSVTFHSSMTIDWAEGGTAPTLTTTAGKADMLGFICTTGGVAFDGFVIGQNI
jgi:hypothetical protein